MKSITLILNCSIIQFLVTEFRVFIKYRNFTEVVFICIRSFKDFSLGGFCSMGYVTTGLVLCWIVAEFAEFGGVLGAIVGESQCQFLYHFLFLITQKFLKNAQ